MSTKHISHSDTFYLKYTIDGNWSEKFLSNVVFLLGLKVHKKEW